jgi:hypothetical protein
MTDFCFFLVRNFSIDLSKNYLNPGEFMESITEIYFLKILSLLCL